MKQLYTRWGRSLDPENVLPEYPRPQLVREKWQSLNGYWDYEKESEGPGDGSPVPLLQK